MDVSWRHRLGRGEIVIIDGGTGTELQRRGVPMDDVNWSGSVLSQHAEVVQEVHQDYIRAGAEVIITNTFGTARYLLEAAGLGDRVEEINRRAVAVARQARQSVAGPQGQPVAIAGSISTLPPRIDQDAYPDPDTELAAYREMAAIFVEEGVDLIALEMMQETTHAPLAMRAALDSGLPVWLGVSCRRGEEGDGPVTFSKPHLDLRVPLAELLPMRPVVVNLMHSEIAAVPEAIEVVREGWAGPIGVYPESGHFIMPDWQFVDVIAPDDFVDEACRWVRAGARLVGGCCGTGPEHIRALRAALPRLEAARTAGAPRP